MNAQHPSWLRFGLVGEGTSGKKL